MTMRNHVENARDNLLLEIAGGISALLLHAHDHGDDKEKVVFKAQAEEILDAHSQLEDALAAEDAEGLMAAGNGG
jgi:hypothetical protein